MKWTIEDTFGSVVIVVGLAGYVASNPKPWAAILIIFCAIWS